MSKMYPETVKIHISDQIIDEAEGCNGNKCGIKVATKKAVGGHAYVYVDASGISISRQAPGEWREKAFLPRKLAQWMIAFDLWTRGKGPRPRPITATLRFHKTTRIGKTKGPNHSARLQAQRETRKANGTNKKYDMRRRIIGLASALAQSGKQIRLEDRAAQP
jgi:hypothetical protein